MHTVLFICTANYYRSRFCEHLFNHLAAQSLLNWTAASRGVVTALGAGNVGSVSPYAIDALLNRGAPLPLTFRDPLQLTEEDLTSAEIIIVLDEDEHRPYMNITFPNWADKVTYWHIGDLHIETTNKAMALAERNIRELIQQLSMYKHSGVSRPLRIGQTFVILLALLSSLTSGCNQRKATEFNNEGIAKYRKGELDGALTDYSKAIELNPTFAVAYNNRGSAKRAKGDLDGAIADYSKAIELDPKHANVYTSRGTAKAEKGDLDGAIADFTKAIEINPKYAIAYNNCGLAKHNKGDLVGAISDYTKAIELNPKLTNAYYNRGNAKKARGDLAGADEDFAWIDKLQNR